jgi:hypothetical protein
MESELLSSPRDDAEAALALLEQALALIDRFDGPGEVGAHVDLAIHRLHDAIPEKPAGEQASTPAELAGS